MRMDSRTTMELATRIPTEIPIPRRVDVLKVYPSHPMTAKVTTTESGMVRPAMIVDRRSWRKRKRIPAVSRTPTRMFTKASFTEAWMKSPSSVTQTSRAPAGSSPWTSRKAFFTLWTTFTALAWDFFTTRSPIQGFPSR